MIQRSMLAVALAACSPEPGEDGGPGALDSSVEGGSPDLVARVGKVLVNEVMAQNQTSWSDETGSHPDWIELWNPNDEEVDISGWWLSDDLAEPFDWQLPEGVVLAPGEHLIVPCDGDDATDGTLHATFHLDAAGGEDVALFGPNVLDNPVVDAIEDMAPQALDVSLARMNDDTWAPDPTPTPGAAND